MTFYWPLAFWLLLIPIALLVRDLLRRRAITTDTHPKIAHAEARHSSLVINRSTSNRTGGRRVRVLFYLALTLATVAVARPQWGRLEEPVFDQSREILIALDLSRSMSADDVKPSRLERARLLITSLLERLKGERVGLVVFSGTAFLQSPLSADYEILREFLPVLEPGYLPEGGTDYDALIQTTLTAFGASSSADRFLIVLSDGEAQTDTWRKHVDELKTKGIRVLALGIGTNSGAMIPDGSGAFIKDERGAVVLSKLNPSTLRELADQTNGVYSDASSWVDLSQLIQSTVEQGRRGEFKDTSTVRLAERFQWPLAAAVVLFLLSFWREFPVRATPRAIQLASPSLKIVALLLLVAAFRPTPSLHAAEPEAAPPPLSAPVTQLVGRLATRPQPSAADYAELARATATFGERAASSKETVPEGAVRDALAAVSAGESIDAKAADWSGLRKQLNALLAKKDPPPPKQDQPKPDEKKPEQNKGDDSKKENDPSKQGDSAQPPEKKEQDEQKSDSKSQQPNEEKAGGDGQPSKDQQSKAGEPNQKKPDSPGQSAFGDMSKEPPPADPADKSPQPDPSSANQPESSEMQKVGGVSAAPSTDPARLDPSLSIPLQKLDQVKQGDSPARLFQLLQEPTEGKPAPKGRDW